MIKGSGGGGYGGGDDDDMGLGDPPGEMTAEALENADDDSLLALGTLVLAELKDRNLLRLLLRNRTDSATVVEVDAIRGGMRGLELVAAGYHAETPDRYEGWVHEADALHTRLSIPGLAEQEAEAILGRASDEALLLGLDRAQEEEGTEPDALPLPPPDSGAGGVGARIAIELLRRGVIESTDRP